MKTIERHYISKIEGHGHLKVDFKKNKADLIIDEGERYFEVLVLNRRFEDGPYITSRICGVCPVAHQMAAIKALEEAFGFEPNQTIIDLRVILLCSQIIQSHILHLFFLALPDYFGLDAAITLAEKDPKKLKLAFDLKHFADVVVEIIGGKAVHPTTPTVGGFRKAPKKEDLKKIQTQAKRHIGKAKEAVDLFSKFKYPELHNKVEYLCLDHNDKYNFLSGSVTSNVDEAFEVKDYKKRIKERVVPPSSAKESTHLGKKIDHFPKERPFMVGALARLVNIGKELKPRAKIEKSDCFSESLPTYNSFHNNIAQAIEILHALELLIEKSENLLNNKWDKTSVEIKPRKGYGVGAVEAPRGILFHAVRTDKNGIIKDYDIVPPTAQNLASLDLDANELLKQYKDISSIKKRELLEMLIRAYDPCITCSVH